MLVCMCVGRIFPWGALVDFSKSFSSGAKSGEIRILPHSKLRKEPFFLKSSNSCFPSNTHAFVPKKVRAAPSKLSCIFKRFNTMPYSEILLNLIRKMKYLTDQFQLCFCFCIGNTKLPYLYLHWHYGNTIGILTADNLLVAAYGLSCLCIPVSSEISDFTPCERAQSNIQGRTQGFFKGGDRNFEKNILLSLKYRLPYLL